MDVDRASFPAVLPSILKHISKSHFISFDLELSGIPGHRQRDHRQTVAERYEEVKQAAETYFVLQVGLTLVEEDVENERYVLRTFNFNLSPLIYEGLHYDRDFTYSSGAVDFLLGQNYKMEAPFLNALPYLTKAEATVARERTRARWDRDAIPDIKISADDTQAQDFMKRTRSEIDAWKKTGKPESDYVNIAGKAPPGTSNAGSDIELNRFERRLVHQIVRMEYPDLRTFSEKTFVRVRQRPTSERPPDVNTVDRRLNRAIFHQTGFRWIAEAMAGKAGDLSGVDAGACAREIEGEKPAEDMKSFVARLDSLRATLKARKPILIGHNCLLDLVYFYKYFYGDLPDTLDGFKEALRAIFPVVIDTKYMATTGQGYFAFRSFQLSQLDESLSDDASPTIEYAKDHPHYSDEAQYHEAGYDSLVTAKIFLRFAMRLQEEAAERSREAVKANNMETTKVSAPPGEEIESKGTTFVAVERKKKPKRKGKSVVEQEIENGSFFSSPNIYQALQKLPAESNPEASETDFLKRNATEIPTTANDDRKGLIPRWDSEFWEVYGNKLRVYGTVEEVCDLAKIETEKSTVAPKEEIRQKGAHRQAGDEDENPSFLSGLGKATGLW